MLYAPAAGPIYTRLLEIFLFATRAVLTCMIVDGAAVDLLILMTITIFILLQSTS
jgi:hypothetical protein